MALNDLNLVELAGKFYLNYAASRSRNHFREPVGVVVNVETHRCDLVFSEHSALLPQEVLIPLAQLRSYLDSC